MNPAQLRRVVAKGEGPDLEFKRSTGEIKAALQTACAFLNGSGGRILFGVGSDGKLLGQTVSDTTLREFAQMAAGFEPRARFATKRVRIGKGREILVLEIGGASDGVPFTFDGRPYERVENTTRRMPQKEYERLLLDRMHSKRRWENQPAEDITIRDIDRTEVYRVVDLARAASRLLGPPERDLGQTLDRLNLRRNGEILRAAVALFGKRFLPDFPQCGIRLARFRGADKAEFLDQKAVHGPAFRLLEEAEVFCQRHFPLPGRIVPGRLERLDTPLIPPDAMREILINALIHRDYSIAGTDVGLAIFDDRVEVWSPGGFPTGITAEALTRDHQSVRRNPLIAEMFYRVGLIERWGRGTNRVAEMCRHHGIRVPEFREVSGAVVVTFRIRVGETEQVTPQVAPQVTPQVVAVLEAARDAARRRSELQSAAHMRDRKYFRRVYLDPVIAAGWLEMTIPDKPQSRLQRYRTTEAGRRAIEDARR